MNSLSLEARIAKLAGQVSTGEEAEELTSSLVRHAAKLVVEQMLDAEVAEVLGRQRYQRTSPPPEGDPSVVPTAPPPGLPQRPQAPAVAFCGGQGADRSAPGAWRRGLVVAAGRAPPQGAGNDTHTAE